MTLLETAGISQDGRSIILAYDHGLEHGPSDVLDNPNGLSPRNVFDTATSDNVNALVVQKGLAESYYPSYNENVNLLVKLNGTTALHNNPHFSPQNCSVEQAVELDADAVGYTVYAGSRREDEMLQEFGRIQEKAREYDMPVVMWSYPRGPAIEDDQSPEVVQYAARIGLELGADMVKVKYPGSQKAAATTAAIADTTSVVLSGGAKTKDTDFLKTVYEIIEAGYSGLAVGRNVWQREDPEQYLEALGAIVHQNKPFEEAAAYLEGNTDEDAG